MSGHRNSVTAHGIQGARVISNTSAGNSGSVLATGGTLCYLNNRNNAELARSTPWNQQIHQIRIVTVT